MYHSHLVLISAISFTFMATIGLGALIGRSSAQTNVQQLSSSGTSSSSSNNKGTQEWRAIKVKLRENKKSMCSFLLVQQSDGNHMELTLDRVADLFAQGLEHVGKSADYIKVMRPYIESQVVQQFDLNGGKFVLEISDARRKLIEEFEDAVANGASDERKGQILEKYFYKACEIKLGSVAAEKSMYATMLKIEKQANKNLREVASGSS